MKYFAVVENGIVLNTIIADTQEVAEQVTSKTCVEYTEENPAVIGLGYNNGVFEHPPVYVPSE